MAGNLDFEYGFDAQGIENLLAEIKGCVITQAAGHATSELSIIRNRCDQIWEGQSKETFLAQLSKDAYKFSDALTSLYAAFEKEIVNAGFNFDNFDKNLFK